MTTLETEIKINPVYEKLIPIPTDNDYQLLYESIKEKGLLNPIVLNPKGEILDGHNRYKICKELGTEIKVEYRDYKTPEAEFQFVKDSNLAKRHMTTFQKCELAYNLESIYAVEAEKNLHLSKGRGQKRCDGIPSQVNSDDAKTRTKVASEVKINPQTYQLAKFIKKKRYDKPDKELDKEIQQIFKDFLIEKGKTKESETVKLFPKQLEELRSFMKSYQNELDKLIHDVRNQETGVEKATSYIRGWDSEIKLEITKQVPKTDLELMEEFDKKPRPYDVWNFPRLDTRFGKPYPGQIPADIVFQTLYFYTEQGQLVVDPMAGGGITGDVCKVMNRKYLMYDINPTSDEVTKHNITKGLPEQAHNADLVFWDPPYYKKLEKDYDHPGSISSMNRTQYLQSFSNAAIDFHDKGVKTIALLISNYRIIQDVDKMNEKDSIWYSDYVNLFHDTGKWQLINEIHCPLSTEQVQPQAHIKFVKEKKISRINRVLFIFKRK